MSHTYIRNLLINEDRPEVCEGQLYNVKSDM